MKQVVDFPTAKQNRPITGAVQARAVRSNGVKIAFNIQGDGPPLVLIMGYRLNSSAWPREFLDSLARRFTVITPDNRGTGKSDKPLDGYAIANLARDVLGLLDALGIARAHILGYSMGGAIAQEFVRQFPERVAGLVLCATMCGGGRAIYAKASVLRVMRDLDELGPEEIARRIWKVTYSPRYLADDTDKIERQMLREIAEPTPLHAADLQFQAFSDFDCSDALPNVRAPTLVLTGDLDQLIPPGNSKTLASLIPGAELRILRGIAHRLMWEAAQDCAHVISDFLREVDSERRALVPGTRLYSPAESALQDNPLTLFVEQWQEALELAARWPLVLNDLASDFMIHVLQPLYFGRRPRIGDGKPIVIVAEDAINRMAVTPFATWLSGIGFRPMMANFAPQDGWLPVETLRETIRCAAERTGRKAIVITLDASLEPVVHATASEPAHVCAIVALAPRIHHGPVPDKLHVHLITTQDDLCSTMGRVHRVTAWPGPIVINPDALITLSDILRQIPIELLASGT
jgi:pimeloyl-ACP methyl ester carboxylesterase